MTTLLKTLGLTLVTVGFTAGTALAGTGKDCKDKTKTTTASVTTDANTAVLSTSATATAPKAKAYKTYTLEEATALCAKKAETKAINQADCIAYKTGQKTKMKAPKS